MIKRIIRKNFCSGTPYHHDFHPGNFNKTNVDFAMAMFEFGRIFFYVYFTFKIAINLPSFALFRKSRYFNNPDYALCDYETYSRTKVKKD